MNYKSIGMHQNKLQHIKQLAPRKFARFVDPAIGDGSTLLNIKPSKWLINEEHIATHNMWKMLKHNPKDVIRCLKSDYFDEISQPAHAALFMYIHDNTSIKTNEGFYNQEYFDNLASISKYLGETDGEITNSKYGDFMDSCKADDFVFLDFANLKYHDSKSYVAESLHILDKKNVMWMLVHFNNAHVRATYDIYNKKEMTFNEDLLLIRNY
jgi:site-specific DNA-adenine methylase